MNISTKFSGGLYPLVRGWTIRPGAGDGTRADGVCGSAAAPAISFSRNSLASYGVIAMGTGSLTALPMSAACSLSDISGWRDGVLYPLAGGRRSGAAQLDLLGPPGRRSGCWPHDGDVDGGADFHFSDIPVRGRRWSSGDRSDRRLRPLWSYRVDGADSPDRKPR